MNKKIEKQLINLNEKVDKILDSSIVNKANKCDFYEKNLKNIKLKVSRIKPTLIESNIGITIEYKIDPITIFIDNGNVYPNEIFKSINLLDLISYDDMSKIQKRIEDIIALQKKQ